MDSIYPIEPCPNWLLGQCQDGPNCSLYHPDLGSLLPAETEYPRYSVPNEVHVARMRYPPAASQCGGRGYDGTNDSCSTCRRFRGISCECQWTVPGGGVTRRLATNCTPPAANDSYDGQSRSVSTSSMPESIPETGRYAETNRELLDRAGIPTKSARGSAEDYVMVSRPPSEGENPASHPLTPAMISGSPASSPSTNPPLFPRPNAHPNWGPVVSSTWSYVADEWEHTFANGVKVIYPDAPVPTGSPAQQHSESQPLKRRRVEQEESPPPAQAMAVFPTDREIDGDVKDWPRYYCP